VLSTAVVTAGILAAYLYRGRTAPAADPQAAARHAAASQHLAAAESGLLPWHLPAPVSREVVVPGRHGKLIVLGGLTPSGASAAGVYSVGTRTGAARRIGALGVAVHDAAGAVTGGRALVFGGGSATSIATVQGFTLPGGHGGAAPGLARARTWRPSPSAPSRTCWVGMTGRGRMRRCWPRRTAARSATSPR